jgi:putative hemolysin
MLNLNAHLKEPVYVLETVTGLELLKQFQSAKVQLVFVVDEYGEIIGIVTLQDLMETITGQLQIANIEDSWALHRDDGSWLFDALIPISELKNCLSPTSFPKGVSHQYQTLNGMLTALLGRLPQLGDKIEWGNWVFEVIDMDGSRADKILASKKIAKSDANTTVKNEH